MIVVLGRTDDGVGAVMVMLVVVEPAAAVLLLSDEKRKEEKQLFPIPYFAPRPSLFTLPLLQEQHNNVRRRARDLCYVNFPALLIRPKDLG